MTSHLTPQQFIDSLDGEWSPVHDGHVESCAACRQQIADLEALVGGVRTVVAPEPSPLFWDHLGQRVRLATSAEAMPSASWWRAAWGPALAMGLAAATLAVVLVLNTGAPAPGMLPTAGRGDLVAVAADAADDSIGGRPAEFVVDMAGSLPMDELQDVARPTRDAAAAVMDQLTPAQRAAFVRLVKAQMRGSE